MPLKTPDFGRMEIIMHINESIECTVSSCAYHSDSDNYCTLNSIKVGTHESNPTQKECTDCESFDSK